MPTTTAMKQVLFSIVKPKKVRKLKMSEIFFKPSRKSLKQKKKKTSNKKKNTSVY